MARFSVLVLAAGSGQRFGGKESKVFAKLDGQLLFLRALQLFVSRDDVVETILVISPNDEDLVKASVIWTGAIGRQRVEMECLLGDRR